jgi:hypothetical protein
VEQPLGPHVLSWFARQRWLAETDDDALLAARLRVADDVLQEQLGRPGAEDPEHLHLRQQVGLRRAFAADTTTAAVVGACDGRLPVGTLVAAVEQLLGGAAADRVDLLRRVRELVEAGVLEPPV